MQATADSTPSPPPPPPPARRGALMGPPTLDKRLNHVSACRAASAEPAPLNRRHWVNSRHRSRPLGPLYRHVSTHDIVQATAELRACCLPAKCISSDHLHRLECSSSSPASRAAAGTGALWALCILSENQDPELQYIM